MKVMPSFARRDHFCFHGAVEHAVVVLHVHELRHTRAPDRGGVLEHLGREVRAADLPHLARGDELGERLEGVADRSVRARHVQEIEVDVSVPRRRRLLSMACPIHRDFRR
jgi:hypothetical protein